MTLASPPTEATGFHSPRGAGRKAIAFWLAVAAVVAADVGSKLWAVNALAPYVPREVVGNVLRFTLGFNTGGAMGVQLGGASRGVFALLAVAVIAILGHYYRRTRRDHTLRALAIGLVIGGAAGNLLDRARSDRGVVDFIDIGVGVHRFWTFNVADAAVTVGSILLAFALAGDQRARQERRQRERAAWARMKGP